MGKSKNGGKPAASQPTSDRKNGKAPKKNPKMFDPIKRRLVSGS